MVRSQLILSTRCLGTEGVSVRELAVAAMLVGANQVSLAASIDPPDPAELRAALSARDLRVACVQAPWARSGALRTLGAGTALEQAEGLELVNASKRHAAAAGAPVLILDLGLADVPDGQARRKQVFRAIEGDGLTAESITARDELVRDREKLEVGALDRLARALFRALKSEPELTVAVTTGEPLLGYPTRPMLEHLLDDLRSPRLQYWHDAARAWQWERLGLERSGAWLGTHASNLAGVTLADARGLTAGLPPGAGEVDFRALQSALPASCLKVVELAPMGMPPLQMAFDYLRSLSYD